MQFLTTAALLISSAIAAFAAPVNTAAIEKGCINTNQSALAFRSVDNTILTALNKENQKATFFVDPAFAVANPYIVSQALQQGHNFGLAISSPDSLVQLLPCPNCDYPVNQTALDAYFASKVATWNQAFGYLKANLNLVAFPNTEYINQVDSNMHNNKYASLQAAIVKKGFSPVIVPFGSDKYIAESAGQHNAVLSNIVNPSALYLDISTPPATNAFWADRSKLTNLEDVAVVQNATKFLVTIGKTVVSASQCFGIAAN
ncbi:UNVERIFIED_CONTAM: hypothetical protein HDU68_003142 [Siphonaria sp. JEL0065]|nr:hypothetical protein HDU68_003142 [Siphonaria sp. JEL0065]